MTSLNRPPASLALRHASGVCTGLDPEVLDTARRMDEARAASTNPGSFVYRGQTYVVPRG